MGVSPNVFRGWLDRAGHDFAHHCKTERHQHQQTDGPIAAHRSLRFLDLVDTRPLLLELGFDGLFAHRRLARHQRVQQAGKVDHEEDDGDLQADPPVGARAETKDGGDDQPERRQHQQSAIHLGRVGIERLLTIPEPTSEHRQAQAEKQVAHDRPCQRRFDNRDEALMQGKAGDDDLGRIVQGGVEQAADGLSQAAGKRLGCPAHQLGKRHDRQRRGRENQDRVETEPVEPECDRNEQEQPVQAHGGYSVVNPNRLTPTA